MRLHAPVRRYLLLIPLVVVLLAIVALLSRNRNSFGIPHDYALDSIQSSKWEAFGGVWTLNDGVAVNNSDERGAKLLTGSLNWTDYSVDADVQLSSEYGDAGLIIRSTDEERGVDSYRGYYAALRSNEITTSDANSLIIGRADQVWTPLGGAPLRQPVVPGHWYHLHLVALGCTFAVSTSTENEDPVAVVSQDPHCFPNGRFGLRSYASGGIWKNVRVGLATEGDLHGLILLAAKHRSAATPLATPTPKVPALVQTESNVAAESVTRLDISPMNLLRLNSASTPVLATVRGAVIGTSPSLFLQDSNGGVAIHGNYDSRIRIGDEVQATGKVQPETFGAALDDAQIQLLWSGDPGPPLSVTTSQAALGTYDYEFVEIKGVLSERAHQSDGSTNFELQSDGQSFIGILAPQQSNTRLPSVSPGSLLSLRGVCVNGLGYTRGQAAFAVVLRSADDINVIAGPSWWTGIRLFAIISTGIILVLLALLLYSRIERWRMKAVIEERVRLAHEMHDTLAQSFAGIGFQLQAVASEVHDVSSPLHKHILLAQELVRSSHEDARRDIFTLRPRSDQTNGVLAALAFSVKRLIRDDSIQTSFTCTGEPRAIPPRLSDALLRIGEEAIANAVQHAKAKRIDVTLSYCRKAVELIIQDNGIGFDLNEKAQRYGIIGMQRRARIVSAALSVNSAKGIGTTVHVSARLPFQLTWINLPRLAFAWLLEILFHDKDATDSNPYRG